MPSVLDGVRALRILFGFLLVFYVFYGRTQLYRRRDYEYLRALSGVRTRKLVRQRLVVVAHKKVSLKGEAVGYKVDEAGLSSDPLSSG